MGELLSRSAAFRLCALLLCRLGKEARAALAADGQLGQAVGAAGGGKEEGGRGGVDVFKALLAPAAGHCAKKPLLCELPTGGVGELGPALTALPKDPTLSSPDPTAALAAGLYADAYGALAAAVVPTQERGGAE